MTNTEWILVGQAKKGDAHAFALLYERYYRDLYHFALCLLKNQQDAEDAVSSSVLKAYENLPRLRKNDSFKSWLFQITVNECKNQQKAKSTYMEDCSVPEPFAEENGFLYPEIEEYLSLLSEEERLIVTLSVFGGYNSKEIAGLVHKRQGSVRSIKSRAFARMRNQLNQAVHKTTGMGGKL